MTVRFNLVQSDALAFVMRGSSGLVEIRVDEYVEAVVRFGVTFITFRWDTGSETWRRIN